MGCALWMLGDSGADDPALSALSFGEVMDRLFALWVADGTARTFDEFCEESR